MFLAIPEVVTIQPNQFVIPFIAAASTVVIAQFISDATKSKDKILKLMMEANIQRDNLLYMHTLSEDKVNKELCEKIIYLSKEVWYKFDIISESFSKRANREINRDFAIIDKFTQEVLGNKVFNRENDTNSVKYYMFRALSLIDAVVHYSSILSVKNSLTIHIKSIFFKMRRNLRNIFILSTQRRKMKDFSAVVLDISTRLKIKKINHDNVNDSLGGPISITPGLRDIESYLSNNLAFEIDNLNLKYYLELEQLLNRKYAGKELLTLLHSYLKILDDLLMKDRVYRRVKKRNS